MFQRRAYDVCPLCSGEQATESAIADCSRHPLYKPSLPASMRWLRCEDCQHLFVDGYFTGAALDALLSDTQPMQVPGYDVQNSRKTWAKVVEDVARLQSRLGGRWLDVGFGNGALLTTAEEFGYEVAGIDLRRSTVERMRQLGYDVYCCEFDEFPVSNLVDIISMADVLEHAPFPKRELAQAHRLLAPGGLLFLSMPNCEAFVWKMLDSMGENPYWRELEHLHNFGRKRLYQLLRETGFEPCRYGVSERYIACMEVIARKPLP